MIQIFRQNFEYWVSFRQKSNNKIFSSNKSHFTYKVKYRILGLHRSFNKNYLAPTGMLRTLLSTSDNGIELSMLTDDDEKKKNPGRPSKQCGFGCISSLVYTYIYIHNMYTYICYDSNI